jgi:hypothetical protein
MLLKSYYKTKQKHWDGDQSKQTQYLFYIIGYMNILYTLFQRKMSLEIECILCLLLLSDTANLRS